MLNNKAMVFPLGISIVLVLDYDSNMLPVVAYLFENGGKNLRNQKYPDTCGRGKTYCFFAIVVVG